MAPSIVVRRTSPKLLVKLTWLETVERRDVCAMHGMCSSSVDAENSWLGLQRQRLDDSLVNSSGSGQSTSVSLTATHLTGKNSVVESTGRAHTSPYTHGNAAPHTPNGTSRAGLSGDGGSSGGNGGGEGGGGEGDRNVQAAEP